MRIFSQTVKKVEMKMENFRCIAARIVVLLWAFEWGWIFLSDICFVTVFMVLVPEILVQGVTEGRKKI